MLFWRYQLFKLTSFFEQEILLQEIKLFFVIYALYFFWESQKALQVLNSGMVYHKKKPFEIEQKDSMYFLEKNCYTYRISLLHKFHP